MNPGREVGDPNGAQAGGNWKMKRRLRHSKAQSLATQLGKDARDPISASLCMFFWGRLGTLVLTQKAFPYLTGCMLNEPGYKDRITHFLLIWTLNVMHGKCYKKKLQDFTEQSACWTSLKHREGQCCHPANRKSESDYSVQEVHLLYQETAVKWCGMVL